MPTIQEIRAVRDTLVRVRFDAPVAGETRYLDPDNYSFSEGLQCLGVVVCEPDTVDLITTPQETDRYYTVEFQPDG